MEKINTIFASKIVEDIVLGITNIVVAAVGIFVYFLTTMADNNFSTGEFVFVSALLCLAVFGNGFFLIMNIAEKSMINKPKRNLELTDKDLKNVKGVETFQIIIDIIVLIVFLIYLTAVIIAIANEKKAGNMIPLPFLMFPNALLSTVNLIQSILVIKKINAEK